MRSTGISALPAESCRGRGPALAGAGVAGRPSRAGLESRVADAQGARDSRSPGIREPFGVRLRGQARTSHRVALGRHVFVDPLRTTVGVEHAHRFLHHAFDAGGDRRVHDGGRAFRADLVVGAPCLAVHELVHGRDRRRQVDDRIVPGEPRRQGCPVEDGHGGRLGSLLGQHGGLLRRPSECGDRVSPTDEGRDRVAADRARSAGNEHLHARIVQRRLRRTIDRAIRAESRIRELWRPTLDARSPA